MPCTQTALKVSIESCSMTPGQYFSKGLAGKETGCCKYRLSWYLLYCPSPSSKPWQYAYLMVAPFLPMTAPTCP